MKYFDYAATCPIRDEALELFVKTSREYYGNPNSLHDIGGKAFSLLTTCRKELANLLGVGAEEVYFTSGGTESNHLGVNALLSAQDDEKKHIITSLAEHSSIQQVLGKMEREGYDITYLPLNPNGVINVNELERAIRKDTALVCIQHGNGEIGTIQPILDIASICQEHQILLHTDCVQTFGKVDIKPIAEVVNSLSISSHKVYGPKGVGAMVVKQNTNWQSPFPSVTHEKGMRPGTINVPGIAAFTIAAQLTVQNRQENMDRAKDFRKAFIEELQPILNRLTVYEGLDDEQLFAIIGFSVEGIEGQWLMLECNRLGFAISTGSACQVGSQAISKTMLALGETDRKGKEFVRVSFGEKTTLEELQALGRSIVQITTIF
ncbi:cysteine desulfurase [Salirhabdus euzebyi]|uniref:Cysteine desulfurase n=1 Tax=Salirhabdus euzebyi TaxID=394506 RepID=A0A841Q626_9BACI|nr:IscS subfamily cysteine desulfurase [Salirhabdus euzebyi]MBB6453860.1 cysteine desulfurase [Salirhabdus euzebyi]